MENSERGNRDILLQFRVTDEEYEIIKKKYKSSDCNATYRHCNAFNNIVESFILHEVPPFLSSFLARA